jgi:hypothetical protein
VGQLNGHVWIGLWSGTSGHKWTHHGFYPDRLLGVPQILWPGQIHEDSGRVTEGAWDVKREYRITPQAYSRALEAIMAWNRDETRWTFLTHCADFTEGVARAAGVGSNLPWSYINGGRNRPELFGEYLKKHGGEVNGVRTAAAAVSNDTPQPLEGVTVDQSSSDARLAEALRLDAEWRGLGPIIRDLLKESQQRGVMGASCRSACTDPGFGACIEGCNRRWSSDALLTRIRELSTRRDEITRRILDLGCSTLGGIRCR